MGGDGSLYIFRKIRIDRRGRIGGQQCNTFGDLAAHRNSGAQHGDGLPIPLDDDFRSGLDALQNGPDIFDQFGLADVNYAWVHTFDLSGFRRASVAFGLQEPFGFDGRHAAGARRRDGLPVSAILHVARMKYSGYVRARSAVRDDVTVRIEIEL
jgi:hypothetical protein